MGGVRNGGQQAVRGPKRNIKKARRGQADGAAVVDDGDDQAAGSDTPVPPAIGVSSTAAPAAGDDDDEDVNSEDEWTKDDYIKQLAGDYVSKKMTEHRDELIRDLIKVVSATVPDQIQDFAAQLTEHSRAAGKLAEG
eukprot:624087-Pyramimonas_sp.AAC.1